MPPSYPRTTTTVLVSMPTMHTACARSLACPISRCVNYYCCCITLSVHLSQVWATQAPAQRCLAYVRRMLGILTACTYAGHSMSHGYVIFGVSCSIAQHPSTTTTTTQSCICKPLRPLAPGMPCLSTCQTHAVATRYQPRQYCDGSSAGTAARASVSVPL